MHLILSRPIVMVCAHTIQGWFGSGKQIALSCGKLIKHAVKQWHLFLLCVNINRPYFSNIIFIHCFIIQPAFPGLHHS